MLKFISHNLENRDRRIYYLLMQVVKLFVSIWGLFGVCWLVGWLVFGEWGFLRLGFYFFGGGVIFVFKIQVYPTSYKGLKLRC